MPDQVLENMADVWGDDVESKGYFSEKLLAITSNKSFYDQEEYLKWLVVANGKILMNKIRMWYDVNIP